MAYDYADGYAVYFGGYNGTSSTYVGSTWEFTGGCWKDLGVLSPSPDPRSEFAMAWDGTDNEVLLFGGADSGSGSGVGCSNSNSYYFYMCGDTWAFKGGAWTNVCDNGDVGVSGTSCAVTPPPMNSPTMAYDPVQSDCISGAPTTGCDILMPGLECTASCTSSSETDADANVPWEFFSGAWHSTTISGNPPARDAATMTYDSTDGYILLYGGEQTTCTSGTCSYLHGTCQKETNAHSNYCDDAWSFKGGTWTEQCVGVADEWGDTDDACYMPGTVGSAMAYDAYEGYVVDFGGFNGWSSVYDSDSHGYVYGAFKWVGSGTDAGDWVAIANPGIYLSRYDPALVYDPGSQDQYLILLGGTNAAAYYATQYIYK